MAEFTGERVIPGEVDSDLFNEHLSRYIFVSRFAAGRRVIDAGCGTGYGSAELAQQAASVLAVDVSEDAVSYAREHFAGPNLRFERADCRAIPEADGSIDLMVAFEVIEHLEDWRGLLREARRLLAPGGRFVVSTPNRLYYAETRRKAGPNPFHVHEFEYEEFLREMRTEFTHVAGILQNHSSGVLFQPVDERHAADARVEGSPAPEESHFFIAICSQEPVDAGPALVYVPRAANVLREREQHIAKLEGELAAKDEWLEKAKSDLARLNDDHQQVLAQYRDQKRELEERNRWAAQLDQELADARKLVDGLQQELNSTTTRLSEAYEAQIAELSEENRRKTEWALETERRLGGELQEKIAELARCAELLQQSEQTMEERTRWALDLQRQVEGLGSQLNLVRASRWMRLGRAVGMGPRLS